MSLESVRAFFAEKAPDISVIQSGKPKMLGLDEVAGITGHEVGGVCPFGLKTPLPVYCDVSLKAFDIVVPAAGSTHSAVRIAPSRMAELTSAEWVDVCQVATEEV
jgi:prolyl-tRNA editing enzyme YbaK/EbsC (Cys-tRNA(Pro) deacylase)